MSEEQAQQLLQQLQMLEGYFNDLSQRQSTLLGVLREATAAIESIKAFSGNSSQDTLVPVGMGTFLKAKTNSSEKFVVNIGAGVAIEKDQDSATNYLEARIKEVDVALQDTNARRQEIASQLEQGKAQLNQMAQAAATKQ